MNVEDPDVARAMPLVRHPKFDWEGHDDRGNSINLSLHMQYTANDTVNKLICDNVRNIMQTSYMVCLASRDWRDEAKQMIVTTFIRRILRKRVRAADKLDGEGDLSLWIEVVEGKTVPADDAAIDLGGDPHDD